jgi:DNA-directed RNA polymerase specialized sigma24 family protein
VNTIKAVEVAQVPSNSQRENSDQLRDCYPNFGKAWTADDEEKLLTLYRSGQHNYEELAVEFGRQPSAIESRLKKLGLEHL